MIAAQARTQTAKTLVIAHAKKLGFDLVGVCAAEPFLSEERTFKQRVRAGLLANWHYPDEDIERNCQPQHVLPGARSIVCTATSYLTAAEPYDPSAPGLRGAVSSYSWSKDYHRVIGGRLRELARFIEREFPGERCLACVDTGPMLDRAAAVRAGIGWFGKSGNVLTKEFGSWVLLGELITTLALPADAPLRTNCGRCTECIALCPTGAIGTDGSVDGRKCVSDLTQMRGPIPRAMRPAIGNRVWGCDDCQSVCPVNERKSLAARGRSSDEFKPLPHIGTSVDLPAVLRMTSAQFRAWFGPTAMAWRGKAVLQRNAAVALGNSRDRRAVAPLIEALSDRKPLVRGHAAWALGRLGGAPARAALKALLQSERDASVREEAELALGSLGTPH